MVDEKKDVIIPEIKQLQILDQAFSKTEIIDVLNDIESLGRQMEVGGQTSYQNKFFVLNPVEFPEGTSGKSRQAIFEGAVRVDVLKGNLFEYKKMLGEMKILQAKMIRANKKLVNANSTKIEEDILEAEGEMDILISETRQKELALENVQAKSKHVLRSIIDFYGEYKVNEELCNKLGFVTAENWNTLEVEDHYWKTVNSRKVQKAAAYAALGMNQQLGDSLPLQNSLDVQEVAMIRDTTLQQLGVVPPTQGGPAITDQSIPETVDRGIGVALKSTEWVLTLKDGTLVPSSSCEFKVGGQCNFRPTIKSVCTIANCRSLGLAKDKM
jgi:hypothetical protein